MARLLRRSSIAAIAALSLLIPFAGNPGQEPGHEPDQKPGFSESVGLHLFPGARQAQAQTTLRAAAVVNDEVVSMLDLAMRTRMVILSIGIEDSPQTRQRLAPQVLRSLIDERLQLQEAERLGIEITEEQVDEAFGRIAEQNNSSPYQFRRMLESNGVMVETMRDRLRAQLAWDQVVAQRIRPRLDISEEQIDSIADRLRDSDGVTQWRLGEIFLSVDNPAREPDVERTANRILADLNNGADFSAVAQQMSQSASASTGGDLGWIQEGQLPEELENALDNMSQGQISQPIRSFDGYHILLVRERRTVEVGQETVRLHQIYVPAQAEGPSPEELRAQMEDAVEDIDSCAAFDKAGSEMEGADAGRLGDIPVDQLPNQVRQEVDGLEVARPSNAVEIDNGVAVFMVCAREQSGISRNLISTRLRQERLDMLTRRHLRNLRRAANVDIRVGGT